MTLDRDELLQTQASLKSYTGTAILVFVLYLCLWFPGLIANVMYLREARRMEALAGHGLPGVGCLTLQLVLSVIGVAIGVLIVLLVTAATRH